MFGFPSVVRFSWATSRQLLHAKAYAVTWHDALDEEDAADERGKIDTHTRRMEHFMGAAISNRSNSDDHIPTIACVPSRDRFHCFQQRRLDIVTVVE